MQITLHKSTSHLYRMISYSHVNKIDCILCPTIAVLIIIAYLHMSFTGSVNNQTINEITFWATNININMRKH